MGSSSSTADVKQKVKTKVINKSDIDLVNKQITKIATDVIMKNAKSCSVRDNSGQEITFEGTVVTGDFNLKEVDQKSQSAVTLTCIQQNKVRNEIVSKLSSNLTTMLKNNYDTKTLTSMMANAESKSKTGIGIGAAKAIAKIKMESDTDIRTVTNKKIQKRCHCV